MLTTLLLAAGLRFWNYGEWSLSNDELSAWVRLQYDSFGELISEGVRPDFHPAGIQVFLYGWTSVFGDSPWSLRLPFVLFGIASLWLSYLIGMRWFGGTAGLFAAGGMAVLQLPLLYSQLARPYSSGLFFALGMVYFWTLLLFDREGRKLKLTAGYSIFTVLCMYDHYFCFFFAGIVGLTGFLFLNKGNWKYYLIAGAGAVILFLPHISVTMEQVSRGGLESWLGPPEEDYLLNFLKYSVYDSVILAMIIGAVVLAAFFLRKQDSGLRKFHYIALAWFFIPYFFGYYYSIKVNPILQYSILLFCFPFLVLFLFSFYGNTEKKPVPWLLGLLLAGGIFTITYEKSFYTTQQFAVFKELAQNTKRWDEMFQQDSVTRFYNLIAHQYIDYYFDREDYKPDYEFARGDDPDFFTRLQKAVHESKSQYFVYGWSNNRHPNEAILIIKEYYPSIVEYHNFFNSQIICFGKRDEVKYYKKWDSLSCHTNEFFDFFYSDTIKAHYSPNGVSELYCEIYFPDSSETDIILVHEIKRADSTIFWKGIHSYEFKYVYPHNMRKIFLLAQRPDNCMPGDVRKVYLWNKDKGCYFPDVLRSIPGYDSLYYD